MTMASDVLQGSMSAQIRQRLTHDPTLNHRQLAAEIGCTPGLVRQVRRTLDLSLLRLRVPAQVQEFLRREARRMGPDVTTADVALAVLKDAMMDDEETREAGR